MKNTTIKRQMIHGYISWIKGEIATENKSAQMKSTIYLECTLKKKTAILKGKIHAVFIFAVETLY